MHIQHIQLKNCGPIENLELEFPHGEERIKPVILVGKNGSGKSIALSYIVNGLLAYKGAAYPESPEVESDMVYKLRSPFYVKANQEYTFARVDYEGGNSYWELVLRRNKKEFGDSPPISVGEKLHDIWEKIPSEESSYLGSHNIFDKNKTTNLLSKRCALYFPPERLEFPAWLNEDNLKYKATVVYPKRIQGYTERRISSYSRFQENLDWIFNLVCDSAIFGQGGERQVLEIVVRVFQIVLQKHSEVTLQIGSRKNRVLTIRENSVIIANSAFQLSSGEISLLSIFLSIVKDFDETNQPIQSAEDIRGIVIIDEIDLHLHSDHLYKVLPALIELFPKVQFVITTHSPLFLLGLSDQLTPEGLTIYQMPDGIEIKPEEFNEFGEVYKAYTNTEAHVLALRSEVLRSQRPILFVEGETDVRYLKEAANRLGYKELFDVIDIRSGNGEPHLKNRWKHYKKYSQDFAVQVILLFDPEFEGDDESTNGMHRIRIDRVEGTPIKKGIEHLFGKNILLRSKKAAVGAIIIQHPTTGTRNGKEIVIKEEQWEVDEDKKTALCNWICENANDDDFKYFEKTLRKIKEILDDHRPS